MKRAVAGIFSLSLGAFVIGAGRAPGPTAAPRPFGEVRHTSVASGTIARALSAVSSARPHKDDDLAERRRKLRDGQSGTYISDILGERDSALSRWPERRDEPLTVWIQPTSKVGDFTTTYVSRVRQAFREWDSLNLPVRFVFVNDSADAEIHVNWIDRFNEPISGRTRWARGDDWLITDANIVLAVHHSQGQQLDEESMRAMALHEIGHLLGLDHTRDTLSVMAPKVRVRQLSDADRATVRLLYAMPAGPLR